MQCESYDRNVDNDTLRYRCVNVELRLRCESDLWNCEKSGFCLAAAADKVLAKRGARSVHETTGSSDRSYITVLACDSASGCPLPPFTVYKWVYVEKDCLAQGLAGDHYGVSESGWMEGSNF